jgi:hypothetical protein
VYGDAFVWCFCDRVGMQRDTSNVKNPTRFFRQMTGSARVQYCCLSDRDRDRQCARNETQAKRRATQIARASHSKRLFYTRGGHTQPMRAGAPALTYTSLLCLRIHTMGCM